MHHSPSWEKASLEFKGSLLGFVIEKLFEYGWSVERWEVLRGLLCSGYGSAHPGGIANRYRKNHGGGVSQWGSIDVIISDQTGWIVDWILVPFVSVILNLFSNLQLNEVKGGTTFRNTDWISFLLAGRLNNLRFSRTWKLSWFWLGLFTDIGSLR